MKIKEFLKFSAATSKIDFIIIILSFVFSGIVFTLFKVENSVTYSTGIAFVVMLITKFVKFKRSNY